MGSRHHEQFNGFKWKIRASKGKKPLRLNVGILFITNSYAKIHLRGEEGGRQGRKKQSQSLQCFSPCKCTLYQISFTNQEIQEISLNQSTSNGIYMRIYVFKTMK